MAGEHYKETSSQIKDSVKATIYEIREIIRMYYERKPERFK
jgi:hypothetical protein